ATFPITAPDGTKNKQGDKITVTVSLRSEDTTESDEGEYWHIYIVDVNGNTVDLDEEQWSNYTVDFQEDIVATQPGETLVVSSGTLVDGDEDTPIVTVQDKPKALGKLVNFFDWMGIGALIESALGLEFAAPQQGAIAGVGSKLAHDPIDPNYMVLV